VADKEGDGNKENGGESHPIVVAELLKRLEAEPGYQNQKKEQGHGKRGELPHQSLPPRFLRVRI
jgi:hypothetical protein